MCAFCVCVVAACVCVLWLCVCVLECGVCVCRCVCVLCVCCGVCGWVRACVRLHVKPTTPDARAAPAPSGARLDARVQQHVRRVGGGVHPLPQPRRRRRRRGRGGGLALGRLRGARGAGAGRGEAGAFGCEVGGAGRAPDGAERGGGAGPEALKGGAFQSNKSTAIGGHSNQTKARQKTTPAGKRQSCNGTDRTPHLGGVQVCGVQLRLQLLAEGLQQRRLGLVPPAPGRAGWGWGGVRGLGEPGPTVVPRWTVPRASCQIMGGCTLHAQLAAWGDETGESKHSDNSAAHTTKRVSRSLSRHPKPTPTSSSRPCRRGLGAEGQSRGVTDQRHV
jgi:hypothetical protein